MTSIAVNGLGRIGKCVSRLLLDSGNLISINSNKLTPQNAAYMLQYDSVHGRLKNIIDYNDNSILYCNHKIKISDKNNLEQLNWTEIDIVLECSGVFNSKELAYKHISNGAKAVIVSAPCVDADYNIILGVSKVPDNLNGKVISVGSCTTNCLANIIKPLHDSLDITSAFMTTIHSYTNDQSLVDSRHLDLRRGRAAGSSMIPTSTGATKMIGEIIPELKGKIDGVAVRVPVDNVSMIDLTFTAEKSASKEDINHIMKAASEKMSNILCYSQEQLVSVDYNHTNYSAIFDATQTKVVNNKLFRVVAWYDNEWGFANRMVDLCKI